MNKSFLIVLPFIAAIFVISAFSEETSGEAKVEQLVNEKRVKYIQELNKKCYDQALALAKAKADTLLTEKARLLEIARRKGGEKPQAPTENAILVPKPTAPVRQPGKTSGEDLGRSGVGTNRNASDRDALRVKN